MAIRSTAFRKGFLIGGLVGAGFLLWNAPQPGWRTREQILETVEGVLFKLLDIPDRMIANRAKPLVDQLVNDGVAAPAEPLLPADIVIDGPRPAELSV